MTQRIARAGLQVAPVIVELLEEQICPGTGVSGETVWSGLAQILADLRPRNDELLAIRDELQAEIDRWHREHPGADYDRAAYQQFLKDIGYLLPEPAPFTVATSNNGTRPGTCAPGAPRSASAHTGPGTEDGLEPAVAAQPGQSLAASVDREHGARHR